jgi:hypothetical protein
MYVVVRNYRTAPGAVADVLTLVRDGFVPTLRRLPGLVDYYGLGTGDGHVSFITICRDRATAHESVRLAAEFARQRLSKLIPEPPLIAEGEVAIHERPYGPGGPEATAP